jgi:predicted PurR-regulated permease PerM
MTKSTVSICVLVLVPLALLVLIPEAFFVIFAGLLLAILLRTGGHWIAAQLGIATGWGSLVFALLVVLSIVGLFVAFASAIAEQTETLYEELPKALESVRSTLSQYRWGKTLLERASPEALMSSGAAARATAAISSTLGAFGTLVIILFIGLYGALDPHTYRRGLLSLLAPSLQPRGTEVLEKTVTALGSWLAAQLLSMAVVGVLTWLGLWLIGIPLSLLLGVIAALLAFIPNIGPIIAAVPAILLAFPSGSTSVALVVAVYVAVQSLESYVITPLIQQEAVALPPAFVIAVQLVLGLLFGVLGLALATPIAAAGMTIVREVYVKDYLSMAGQQKE